MGINKNFMRFDKILILMMCFIVCLSLVSAEITILREFAGGNNDGANPYYTSLILDSGNLYGMTRYGGDSNLGTVFSLGTDGSGFSLLREFAGGVNDGGEPHGSLILDSGSSKFYGMTIYGGSASNAGIVFSIGMDGNDFSLLHNFTSGADNGGWPQGSLILDSGSSKLYGMTKQGGDSNLGTIFSISTSGSGFTLLHEFEGYDGKLPYGSLILDSGKLYGMTYQGGSSNLGTIFSMNPDGSSFSLLHEFAGGVDDGYKSYGSLILDSGKLYGMTPWGGDSSYGTIFSIETTGSNFSLLHEFAGGVDEGRNPRGSLILDSGKLYGMTYGGGDSDVGTVFSMGTDGSGFLLLHEFAGNDGLNPYGSLILNSDKLYGMTYSGGGSSLGTIFSIQLGSNEPIYSNFTSSETTNFSAVDVTNVTSLALVIDNKGRIVFPSNHSINADGENYDINIKIEDKVIFVNSSALDSSFNSSATLTFYNVDCNKPYVFYSETASAFAAILSENQRCLEPLCQNIECIGSTLTVDVDHFTGFAAGTDANLTTEAQAGVFYPLDPIEFTAEYINSTDGTPISGTCNIKFDENWTAEYPMDYNGSQYNYTKSSGFATDGLHEYNVTCANASFVTLEANDTKLVTSVDIPEFSVLTLGFGLIAVLIGLFVMRKKK